MPEGAFVIIMPKDSDYKVLGYYLKKPNLKFEVTSELFLRLNLDHSKSDYTHVKLKGTSLVSYHHKFVGKLDRKASGIYMGLLLSEDDEPDKFKNSQSLKATAETISTFNILEMSKQEFEKKLKEVYDEKLEAVPDLVNPEAIKINVVNRSKEMLSGGKKERTNAKVLLQKIEEGVQNKIYEFYKAGQEALKTSEFDLVGKSFEKAAELADELYETELANTLRQQAKLTLDVPMIEKLRDKVLIDAKSALRSEDIYKAYISYKRASELSKELLDLEKEEEYRLKSKALYDFHQVDERFKKK